MNMTVQKTPAEQAFVEQFAAAQGDLPGASTDWVADLRKGALNSFDRSGLPHRRMEDWKYTDLRRFVANGSPVVTGNHTPSTDSVPELFKGVERYIISIVDGKLVTDLDQVSWPDGVTVMDLNSAFKSGETWVRDAIATPGGQANAVTNLNTAFMSDGVAVRIGAGVVVDRPIEIVTWAASKEAGTVSTRNIIVLEAGARATVLETFPGQTVGSKTTNIVNSIRLSSGARLEHVKLQEEEADAIHLYNQSVHLGEDSNLNSFTATFGAGVSRNEGSLLFDGEGAHATVAGGYMISGKQHCDTTLLVDHVVPGCTSNELFKGVIDDSARGVFQGKIIVRPDAQKTDGRMMTQGLLLSEDAEFDAKPELEIYADDVQCAHGATSGELDEDYLFYLQSRGIPENEAKAMLIAAFVAEAIETVENEQIRDILIARTQARFALASTKGLDNA